MPRGEQHFQAGGPGEYNKYAWSAAEKRKFWANYEALKDHDLRSEKLSELIGTRSAKQVDHFIDDHVPDAPKLRASARSLTQPETEKFIRLLYDAGATFAGGRATFPGSGAKRGFWVRVAADFGVDRTWIIDQYKRMDLDAAWLSAFVKILEKNLGPHGERAAVRALNAQHREVHEAHADADAAMLEEAEAAKKAREREREEQREEERAERDRLHEECIAPPQRRCNFRRRPCCPSGAAWRISSRATGRTSGTASSRTGPTTRASGRSAGPRTRPNEFVFPLRCTRAAARISS